MRLTTRILLLTSIVVIVISLLSPGQAQAQTQKISPGTYMGRFRYSAYNMMVDKQSLGEISSLVDYQYNTYVEGTLTIRVDKNGNILPGIKFIPDSVSTYFMYSTRITPAACDVTGYLEGETKLVLKHNTAEIFVPSAPAFSATVKFSNVTPLSYWQRGIKSDCPYPSSRASLEKGINEQVRVLNNLNLMKFTVVSISKDQFSGTMIMKGYAQRLPTPGGFIETKDKDGFFNVHKNDVLAPLTEEELASLVEEWRSK